MACRGRQHALLVCCSVTMLVFVFLEGVSLGAVATAAVGQMSTEALQEPHMDAPGCFALTDSDPFVIGRYAMGESVPSSQWVHAFSACDNVDTRLAEALARAFAANQNRELKDVQGLWEMEALGVTHEQATGLSHTLNDCYVLRPDAELRAKELFLQGAVVADPSNAFVVKNLAFLLENHAQADRAASLIGQCIHKWNPGDVGLLLAEAIVSELHFASHNEAWCWYQRGLSHMQQLQERARRHEVGVRVDPALDIFRQLDTALTYSVSALPFGWFYLGYPFHPLISQLASLVARLYPQFQQAQIPPLSPPDSSDAEIVRGTLANARHLAKPIRLGIFPEAHGNTSPGLLIGEVLKQLATRDDGRAVELVFFSFPDLYTTFSENMEELSSETVTLDRRNITTARLIVAERRLDVLLYLALPTDRFAWFLANSRLAPVQMAFGHGHPLTSGSPNIDYFVSSRHFYSHPLRARSVSRSASAGAGGTAPQQAQLPTTFGEGTPQAGVEQTVLMDSLTTYWPPFAYTNVTVSVHPYQVRPPQYASAERGRTYFGLRKEDIVFACLQHSKKFHPQFDTVLRGILARLRDAVILVPESPLVRLHMRRRWIRANGWTQDMLDRMRFFPRLAHADLLSLLAVSDAMLDPFPWGAGVTSFEALETCLPVITFPRGISVLQLALGQLRALDGRTPPSVHESESACPVRDPEEKLQRPNAFPHDLVDESLLLEEALAADSVEEYINIAALIGTQPAYAQYIRTNICERRRRVFCAHAAVEEWASLLSRVVSTQTHE